MDEIVSCIVTCHPGLATKDTCGDIMTPCHSCQWLAPHRYNQLATVPGGCFQQVDTFCLELGYSDFHGGI